MYGDDIYDDENRGIIPRLINDIFEFVENAEENITFQFKMSILQIYKENIYDLLTGENNLKIKENPIKGIYVDKLTEVYIDSFDTFMEYVDLAQENRIVSETKLNSYSSRSHSILIFEVTQNLHNANFSKKGTLNLVDLAGSEKISKSGAVGETLEEAKKINLSLSALGNVIHALTTNSDHIPYRDSKLTRILQESLGGNFKTSLIVTCSPHSYHFEETTSSLKFAQRVKHIKNKVKINIKLTYEELQKINSQLRKELGNIKIENKKLRELLNSNGIEFIIENQFDDNNNNDNNDNNENNDNNDNNDDSGDEDKKKFMSTKNFIKDSNKKDFYTKQFNAKSTADLNSNCDTTKENDDYLSKTQSQSKLHGNYNSHDNLIRNIYLDHAKIIKDLKKQIDELNNEIKEKDNIISTLEESNRKKQKIEIKDSGIIFSNEPCDINKVIKDLHDLYDDIRKEMIKIEFDYRDIKNKNNNEEIISNFEKLINDLNLIKEKNINEEIESFKGLSSIILNSLNNYKVNDKLDEKIKNLNNKYQKNIIQLYNDIFDNSNEKKIKFKFIKHATYFIYGYLESFFILNFNSHINQKLLLDNNLLLESNNLLLKIVEDLLKSNLDLSNKLTNINYEQLSKSIIGNKINFPLGNNNEQFKVSFLESNQIPSNFKHYKKNKNKIMTLINRKGLDMLKKQKRNNNELIEGIKHKRENSSNLNTNNNLNDGMIIQNPYSAWSYKPNNEITNIMENIGNDRFDSLNDGESKIIDNLRNFNLYETRNENSIKLDEGFYKSSFKNEPPKVFIPISETENLKIKQEKKKSKLTMLKEYIVKSLTQSENYKKEINILKDAFIIILDEQLKMILSVLNNNNFINEEGMNEISKTFENNNIESLMNESINKSKRKIISNKFEISFENDNIQIQDENDENIINNDNLEENINNEKTINDKTNKNENKINIKINNKNMSKNDSKKNFSSNSIEDIKLYAPKQQNKFIKDKNKTKKKKNFVSENEEIKYQLKDELTQNATSINDNSKLKKSKNALFGNMKKQNQEIKLVPQNEILNNNINPNNSNLFNFYKNTSNSNPKSIKSNNNKTINNNYNSNKNSNQENSHLRKSTPNSENKMTSNIFNYNQNINTSKKNQNLFNKNKNYHSANQFIIEEEEEKKQINKISQNLNGSITARGVKIINSSNIKNLKKNSAPDSPIKNSKFMQNFDINYKDDKTTIEDLVADYLKTGTATRRFDGIGITFKNQEVKCLFRGGLSANNSIDITPVGKHIKSLNGDDYIPNPEDFL